MFLVPLLLIIVVIFSIVYFTRLPQSNTTNSNSTQQNYNSSDKSLHVLKERYAKGEITEEEFFKIKKNL